MNGQRIELNGPGIEGDRRPINGGLSSHLPEQVHTGLLKSSSIPSQQSEPRAKTKEEGVPSKADSMIDREDELTNAKASEVLDLRMHSSEVFMCAWNPIFTYMIATGSGDASARIWEMGGPKAENGLGPVRLLPHGTGPRDRKNKDVTTLEWSSYRNCLKVNSCLFCST